MMLSENSTADPAVIVSSIHELKESGLKEVVRNVIEETNL